MTIVVENIEFGNAQLGLTNQRALFWESEGLLVISDIHIGKTAHFRKHGIAIPDDVMYKDIKRLEDLVNYFNPKTIVVAGDLFHANYNSNIKFFKDWLRKLLVKFVLVKGNHDRFSTQFYMDLGIDDVVNHLDVGAIRFVHEPSMDSSSKFIISGHLHPGIALRLKGGKQVKLPCFALDSNQMILPAFSQFTGLNTTSSENAICYAFTDESIFKIENAIP